jgi:threonylcarbamoyladenosine tRNA methylthiotransferase MtaB
LFEPENRNGFIYGFSTNYVRIKTPWRSSIKDKIIPFELKNISDDGLVTGEVSIMEAIV